MNHSISVLRAFALLWGMVVCPLAILLLLSCVTWQGALVGSAAFLLGLAPGLAWMDPERLWLRRLAFACLTGWLLIAIALFQTAPTGRTADESRVQNRYVGGEWRYNRHALGALLPEVDQFMLGFKLVPLVDRLFTTKQARSLSGMTRAIYSELEADPNFRSLGSVMPDAYDDLWGFSFPVGHYFLYASPNLDRQKPAPVLVFLHGSGGNFKAYTWLLSSVANELGMVLIAPSFGMGNWDTKHTSRVVEAALDDAAKILPLNLQQAHLAGLSNGGLGVSQVTVSNAGSRFRSLIFLSPVFDERTLSSFASAPKWRDKPVLVITGTADDRVPLRDVERNAAVLRGFGTHVELSTYEGADHFLFFSHRERCIGEISAWLKTQLSAPTPNTIKQP